MSNINQIENLQLLIDSVRDEQERTHLLAALEFFSVLTGTQEAQQIQEDLNSANDSFGGSFIELLRLCLTSRKRINNSTRLAFI